MINQNKLEKYYNSLGFIKQDERTQYGTQEYSTNIDILIPKINTYVKELSGGKRKINIKSKPKRKTRKMKK
jgi:hypothetical protein